MKNNEEKLLTIIEHLTVSLINSHLSINKLHLKKHEYSPYGYNFCDESGKIVTISNDSKMEIKELFENNIYDDKIGLGFEPDEGYLLLGFDKLKSSLTTVED